MRNLAENEPEHALLRPRPVDEPPRDEIGLADYLATLWQYRLMIAAATILAALGALVVGWITPPVYEARALLMINGASSGTSQNAAFRTLLSTYVLAEQVIKKVGLDKEPYYLTPARLVNGPLKVEEVPGTSYLQLQIRMRDPQIATTVANTYAHEAVSFNRRLLQEGDIQLRDFLKIKLDQARRNAEDAETRLLAYKRTAHIEMQRKDVDALLSQRGDILPLLVQIAAEEAQVRKASEELAKQPRTVTFQRSIDSDPALLEASRQSGASNPLSLQLKDESGNPIYWMLQEQIIKFQTSLSGLYRRRDELMKSDKISAARLAQLNELYSRESQLATLQMEADLSKRLYSEIATRYEQARIETEANPNRQTELRFVDSALPPEAAVAPNIGRNTVVAGVFGFVLSVVAAFLVNYLRSLPHPRSPRAVA